MRSATRYPKGGKTPGKADQGEQTEYPTMGPHSDKSASGYYGKRERKFKSYETKTTRTMGKNFKRTKR